MEHYEYSWMSADGLRMYGQAWDPGSDPRAVVCLVHGLGEHSGRYAYVGNKFAEAGYALLAYDIRGHGKSEGLRGHSPSYDHLMDDIAHLLKEAGERYPRKPRFLYGHSLGGNLVLNYALRRQPQLAGVISTGPWLDLAVSPPRWKTTMGKMLCNPMPTLALANGLDLSALSRDPAIVAAYENDPLVHDRISTRIGVDLLDSAQYALQHARDMHIPLLLMHGGADRITSAPASQKFSSQVTGDCTFKAWDGCFHEIHNEPEKDHVIQCMIDWLNLHVPPSSR